MMTKQEEIERDEREKMMNRHFRDSYLAKYSNFKGNPAGGGVRIDRKGGSANYGGAKYLEEDL